MGILNDDAVLIKEAEKAGDKTLITVNCPDKTGLGCDLCRIILLFGLSIAKGGISFYPLYRISNKLYFIFRHIFIFL